jgi:tRNA-dihydrouridine synthase B
MTRLYSSPLQGFTDFRFRNAFYEHFGGIDQYMAPYIRLNGKMEIKASRLRDISPENNYTPYLVPQIITKDAGELLFVAEAVQKIGYKELNWNLGCPYPMVAKRGMGSGLLSKPEIIDEVMHRVSEESDIRLSVKMRLGYESTEEIFAVLPVLEKYELENISIHPRIGKQLYKGEVDLDSFELCLGQSSHTIIYNGDITSVQAFGKLKERFSYIDHWMIGRGLISDPFLPSMIKADNLIYPEDRYERFKEFHDSLFSSYEEALSGTKHLLLRMLQFWEYFIRSFPSSPKGLKMIKKAKDYNSYQRAVQQIFSSEVSPKPSHI